MYFNLTQYSQTSQKVIKKNRIVCIVVLLYLYVLFLPSAISFIITCIKKTKCHTGLGWGGFNLMCAQDARYQTNQTVKPNACSLCSAFLLHQVKPSTWRGISVTSARRSFPPKPWASTSTGSTRTPTSCTRGKTCCWRQSECDGAFD